MPCQICRNCLIEKPLTDFRLRKKLNIHYRSCRQCETIKHKEWQSAHLDWYRAKNKRYYQRISDGKTIRRNKLDHTPETKAQWARDKSNRRCTRAKQVRFFDELTILITVEAHELRKVRNSITGFEWHVDHILPLNGTNICGLHIWSNLQVIPKKENLQKGAKNSVDA
jgi:hypothetical protein